MNQRKGSQNSGPRWWRRLRRKFRHGDGVFWVEVCIAIGLIAAVSLLALSLF